MMKLRKIFWLCLLAAYLMLSVKLAVGLVLPALRPHGTDATGALFYAEMYGPVRAALSSLILSWLVGFMACAWGLRQACRRADV